MYKGFNEASREFLSDVSFGSNELLHIKVILTIVEKVPFIAMSLPLWLILVFKVFIG